MGLSKYLGSINFLAMYLCSKLGCCAHQWGSLWQNSGIVEINIGEVVKNNKIEA